MFCWFCFFNKPASEYLDAFNYHWTKYKNNVATRELLFKKKSV